MHRVFVLHSSIHHVCFFPSTLSHPHTLLVIDEFYWGLFDILIDRVGRDPYRATYLFGKIESALAMKLVVGGVG